MTREGAAAWQRGCAAVRGGGMDGQVYIDRAEAALAADPRLDVDEAAVTLLLTEMETGVRAGQAEIIAADAPPEHTHPGTGAIN